MAMQAVIQIGGDATGAMSAIDKVEKKVAGMFRGERAVERQMHGMFDSLAKAKSWEEVGRSGMGHMLRAMNIGMGPAIGAMAGMALYEGLSEAAKESTEISGNLSKIDSMRFDKISDSFESALKFSDDVSKNLDEQKKKIEENSQGLKGLIYKFLGLKQIDEENLAGSEKVGQSKFQLAANEALEKEVNLQQMKLDGKEKEVELIKLGQESLKEQAKLEEASKNATGKDLELAQKNLQLIKDKYDILGKEVNKKYDDKDKDFRNSSNQQLITAYAEESEAGLRDQSQLIHSRAGTQRDKIISKYESDMSSDKLDPYQKTLAEHVKDAQIRAINAKENREIQDYQIEQRRKESAIAERMGGVSSLARVGGGGRVAADHQQKQTDLLHQIMVNTKPKNAVMNIA